MGSPKGVVVLVVLVLLLDCLLHRRGREGRNFGYPDAAPEVMKKALSYQEALIDEKDVDSKTRVIPIELVSRNQFDAWLKEQDPRTRGFLSFKGEENTAKHGEGGIGLISSWSASPLEDEGGGIDKVVYYIKDNVLKLSEPFVLSSLSNSLPAATYRLTDYQNGTKLADPTLAAFSWPIDTYRIDRYKEKPPKAARSRLIWPEGTDEDKVFATTSEMPVEGGETRLRLVVLGSGGSKPTGPGKSTLIERYLAGRYISPLISTSGVDTKSKQIIIKGRAFNRRLSIQFMELTSNDGNLANVAPTYLSKCDAIIYVYDSTDHESFKSVTALHKLVAQQTKPHINAVLFATKCDLEREKQVTTVEAAQLARQLGVQLFETSAMTGVNVDAAMLSIIRMTAIRIAMAYADSGLVDSLMTLSVPPSLTTAPDESSSASYSDEGFTALHYACRFAGHDVFKNLLLRKGLDLNAIDVKGRTALHIATVYNQMKCVRALLKAGVDVTLVDRAQNTAMVIAERQGNTELYSLLSKAHTSFLFNEAIKAGASAPHKCKLILLGSGGSGKTSLWRGLRGLPRKDSTGRLMRTLLFETSSTLLSELETVLDVHEGDLLTPNSRSIIPQQQHANQNQRSRLPSEDDDDEDDEDHSCQSFTVQVIQTLLGIRRNKKAQQPVSTFEEHPLASPNSFPQDDVGEITITCWDIAGQDSAAPLQPTLIENYNVAIICFDLAKAQFGREEMLKELSYWFSLLDSQERRPGSLRAGISPRSGLNLYQRHDVLLVGTFNDSLTINAGQGPNGDQERARLLEDISVSICQRVGHFESFARLRLPQLSKGRIFYAVGTNHAEADDLGSLRRALCKAILKNGPLRKSRPTMWLRILDELRSVPAVGSVGSNASYRHAVSYEQARQIANKIAYEYTNRPMALAMFQLMLRLLEELGEIVTLGTEIVIPRKEYVLCIYQKLVKKCRQLEISPRKRGSASVNTPRSPEFIALLQHLRTSGSLELDHVKQLLSPEDGPYADICVRVMETLDLAFRMNAADDRNGRGGRDNLSLSTTASLSSILAFFPAMPLSMNEEHFAFPVDSPSVYDELSGKVICFYAFHELVPTGLLARLVLYGMRPKTYEIGGFKFAYRYWVQPVLARDHVEISQEGYTISLTVDHRRARISCALACQEGCYLTPAMEAQIGLIIYDMFEALRKTTYARFKMDLLVVEDGRVYDFVTDILLLHKAGSQIGSSSHHPQQTNGSGGPSTTNLPSTTGSSPSTGTAGNHFDFGGLLSDTSRQASPRSYLPHVVHWAMVMISAPTSTFKPLPSALIHGTMASANARSARLLQSWIVRLPIGRLHVILPDKRALVLAVHPGGLRRRSKNSAYTALVDENHPSALTAYWRLEPIKGGFRIRVGEEAGPQGMAGWYLGLTSRGGSGSTTAQGETTQQKDRIHVIVNQDPVRATIWSADEVQGLYLRLRWSGKEYRYLTEGAKDARAPDLRLVVVGGEAHRRPWHFNVVDAAEIAANQYTSPRQHQANGGAGGPSIDSLLSKSLRSSSFSTIPTTTTTAPSNHRSTAGGGGAAVTRGNYTSHTGSHQQHHGGGIGVGHHERELKAAASNPTAVRTVIKALLHEMARAVTDRIQLSQGEDEEENGSAINPLALTSPVLPAVHRRLLLQQQSSSIGEDEEEKGGRGTPSSSHSPSSVIEEEASEAGVTSREGDSSGDEGRVGEGGEGKGTGKGSPSKRGIQTSEVVALEPKASLIEQPTSITSIDLSQSEAERSYTML